MILMFMYLFSSLLSTKYEVIAQTCGSATDCFYVHNNQSCISVINNTGNTDWFTSAADCENTGGRLFWMHDTDIKALSDDSVTDSPNCPGCTFLWIGLVQSVYKDEAYFWKRPRNETMQQCRSNVTCVDCATNLTESECELLGCCYKDRSCVYPGDLIHDRENEYAFHGKRKNSSEGYRLCVGLQEYQNGSWIFRTVDCHKRGLPRNGYICEYKCGFAWPTPTPLKNISLITAADTGCGTNLTISNMTTSSVDADQCINSLVGHCVPIHDRNSCLSIHHTNKSNDWFTSARACEENDGRLLWLYDKNITVFMKIGVATYMRTACPNCTFMWIGLMQSTLHDDNFFWKRTRNETLQQCQQSISNDNCAYNVSKDQCELLGCCSKNISCFYPGNVDVDRRHEYTEINQRNNSTPGYRRCVGLHKPSNAAAWTLSVETCTNNITYEHGYFCEHKCGNDWPVPTLSPNYTATPNLTTVPTPTSVSTLLSSPKVSSSSVSTRKLSSSVSLSSVSTHLLSSGWYSSSVSTQVLSSAVPSSSGNTQLPSFSVTVSSVSTQLPKTSTGSSSSVSTQLPNTSTWSSSSVSTQLPKTSTESSSSVGTQLPKTSTGSSSSVSTQLPKTSEESSSSVSTQLSKTSIGSSLSVSTQLSKTSTGSSSSVSTQLSKTSTGTLSSVSTQLLNTSTVATSSVSTQLPKTSTVATSSVNTTTATSSSVRPQLLSSTALSSSFRLHASTGSSLSVTPQLPSSISSSSVNTQTKLSLEPSSSVSIQSHPSSNTVPISFATSDSTVSSTSTVISASINKFFTGRKQTVVSSPATLNKHRTTKDSAIDLSTGAIIGIAMGTAVLVFLVIVVISLCLRQQTKSRIGTITAKDTSPGTGMTQSQSINIAFGTGKRKESETKMDNYIQTETI